MVKISRSARNIKLALLGLLLSAAPARAAVTVTGIEIQSPAGGSYANIVLNDIIAIREIEIKGNIKTGNFTLAYPDYVNKQGRSIPQVEIVNEPVAQTIRQAIKVGTPPATDASAGAAQKQVDFNYKIAKISLLRQKDRGLKAFVQVLINGAVKVEARVMESKTGLWVAWPGRKDGAGKWHDQFKILNYSAGQKLDNAIIEKYKVVCSEEP